MRLLFVHQNFPGQYRHLAAHYASQPGIEVAAIGEKANLLRRGEALRGVKLFGYELGKMPQAAAFDAPVLKAIHRGRRVAAAAAHLKRAGFKPDVIFTHNG